MGSSKKRYQGFLKQFEKSASFYVAITGNNFETRFLKNENLFLKNGVPFAFLVESTKIKIAIVKTNRMKNAKWTYHKELSFASNWFIFLKI